MINELTVEAEKLEDIIRTALKGVAGLQEENKRQADKLTQQFSLLAGVFGSFGTQGPAGRISIPAIVQKSVAYLITSVTVLLGKDELNNDPAVQKLRNIIQTSGLLTVEGIAALSKLKDIFAARDGIAKAQMAFKVYEAFGNKTQMEAVHAQAEEARRKLASLGVAKVQYEAGKDLSGYFKQPAVKACDYDPSITAESVPLIHNEEYLLLLRMAMEKSAAGNYARSQLEVKRLQIEAAERKLALDSNTEAKKYNFEEYSKTLIGNTWVLSKNGITDQEAAQASIAYQEAIRNGEIKSNLDNVPVDIMQEQILAAKDGTNYWTGAKLSKLQAYGIIISSVVASFQGIEGMRGNVKIKRSLPLHPGAGEISASRVKKVNVPLSEGKGKSSSADSNIGVVSEGSGGQNLLSSIGKVDKAPSTVKYLEDGIRNEPFEHGLFFDNDGNVIGRLISDGEQAKIDLSAYKDIAKDTTFTHNHPSSSRFSIADLETVVYFDMAEIRAVTPNGVTFSIKRGTLGWAIHPLDVEKVFKQTQRELSSDPMVQALFKEGNTEAVWDRLYSKMAEKMGGDFNVFK
ncbi:hypothetical protein [Paenibacillus sp. FSL R10-2771]|uniref:hypothetical protein n=1 Tax=Paenibacillus sp. FSL R10-2771 TaxID=2954693 RepID=UPI0030F7397E